MRQIQSIARMALPIALGAGLSLAAQAQQVVLKVHHFLPSTSSAQVHLIQPWCDKVSKESLGQIKCQIYPAMQLGGTPAQLFDQIRDGVVDVGWTIPTYAAGRFVKSEAFELPFITRTAKGSSQALWSYVQQNALDEYKGTKLIITHVHDGGLLFFKSLTPTKMEDLKGLKMRAAQRMGTHFLSALGAAPVQMPLPQVPEAMAKGVIDGTGGVPWEGVPAIKMQEIAKYALDTPPNMPRMGNTIFVLAMNQERYNSLPANLKKIIDNNSGLAMSAWAGQTAFDAVVEPHKELMRKQGGKLATISDAEYQRWVEATKSVEQNWIKTISAKGADGTKLLADVRALVKQYEE